MEHQYEAASNVSRVAERDVWPIEDSNTFQLDVVAKLLKDKSVETVPTTEQHIVDWMLGHSDTLDRFRKEQLEGQGGRTLYAKYLLNRESAIEEACTWLSGQVTH